MSSCAAAARRIVASTIILACAASVAFVVARSVPVVAFPYDLINDYDSNHLEIARRILDGELDRLYIAPDQRGFVASSYPPLHFFLLAGMIRAFGFSVILPRELALAAFLGIIAGAGIGGARSKSPAAGAAVATVTLWFLLALGGFPVFGTVDYPMILLSTTAFFHIALRARDACGAVVAGLLVALACLMKQTAVLTGIACAAFLLIERRAALLPFLASWILSAGIPLVTLNAMNHGYLYLHTVRVLGKIIILDYGKIRGELSGFLLSAGACVIIGMLGAFRNPLRRPVDLLAALHVTSWCGGIAPSLFKDGTSFAYLGPIAPAAAVLFVSAIEGCVVRRERALATCMTLLAMTPLVMRATARPVALTPGYEEDGRRLTEIVRSGDGPILTDRHHGWLLANGRRPEYDLKLIWWLERRAGITAATSLVRDLRARRYAMVLSSDAYLLPEESDALAAGYDRDTAIAIASRPGDPYPYRFLVWRRKSTTP